MIIGSHVGFRKEDQIIGSIKEALSYGSNTFMFYTGAPQNTNRMPIDEKLVAEGKEMMLQNNIDINNVIVHAPYIINPANRANLDFNVRFLKEELKRVEELGVSKLVLHPGSHVGLGEVQGLQNIIECLNLALNMDTNVKILLETMAGKGSELGKTFEEIKTILDGVIEKDKVAVCLDTCHINDAGYDLNDFDKVLEEFDKIIGLDKLECIHVNDSKNERSSHKDRHENIGFGTIGFANLINILYHEKLKDVPKILETPYVLDRTYPPYKFEIEAIKNKKFNENLIEDIKAYYEG